MAYRANCVSQEPLDYFLQKRDGEPHLRVSDVILRINQNPKEIFPHLIRMATNSKLHISDPVPEDILDLLKTATPADFNNSPDLEWHYIIRKGWVWRIDENVPVDYQPQDEDEAEVLKLMGPENL